jgi:uncharacterized 2Fe-2S/4Fe-4S cluster protein (DUF4445 family)
MPTVTFKPSGVTVEVASGSSLLDAAQKAGVTIDADCGGQGVCAGCAVRVVLGQVKSDGWADLSREQVAQGYALACLAQIQDSDLVVEVPQQSARTGGQFAETEDYWMLVSPERLPRPDEREPIATRVWVDVPQPVAEDGLSDADRLTKALAQTYPQPEISLTALRALADAVRAEGGRVTATLVRQQDRCHIVAIEPGRGSLDHYGIAVDVGTTTVAIQLVRLPDAEIAATVTNYNDQISCGLDIISRINYARGHGKRDELRRRVLETINRLVAKLVKTNKINARQILSASVSGNTTMVHLLLGLNPEYIRLEPYVPTVYQLPLLTAGEVGLEIDASAPVRVSPCVGSYVGGDITAGLLCTELAYDSDRVSLFMDIGTNGEVVLGNRDFLVGCACSAGPAFEGGGITCGMRAAEGAIDRVTIDPRTGIARYGTVGAAPAQGICGSGIISLLAHLFISGWIDAAGKLERERPCEAIRIDGRRAHYVVAPAYQTATGRPIAVSELDIENVIRAKAAVYSACSLMFAQLGINDQELGAVYIAGGFGRFLDIESAIVIGLLPDLPRERFRYVGNASLMGSYMTLVSKAHRERQQKVAKRMTYLELNTTPTYMEQYTGALFLPHTEQMRFPTIQKKLKERQTGLDR